MSRLAASRPWVLILQAACSIGLLAYLLSVIPFDSLLTAVTDATIPLVALGLIGMLGAYWLDAVQIMWVLARQEIAAGSIKVLKINLICMFYSLFLPTMIAGGAIRWYHFTKIAGRPAEALAAILFNRVFETLLLVTVGTLAFVLELRGRVALDLGFLMMAMLVVVLGTYAIAFNRHVHTWTKWIVSRLPLAALKGPLIRVLDALSRFDGMGPAFHLKLFLFGLLRQTVAVGLVMVFVYALQIDVGVMTIVWVRSLVAILTMVPLSIAGLGIRETTFVMVLGQYDVSGGHALALSLLLFSRTVVYGFIGGIIEADRVFRPGNQSLEVPRENLSN